MWNFGYVVKNVLLVFESLFLFVTNIGKKNSQLMNYYIFWYVAVRILSRKADFWQ